MEKLKKYNPRSPKDRDALDAMLQRYREEERRLSETGITSRLPYLLAQQSIAAYDKGKAISVPPLPTNTSGLLTQNMRAPTFEDEMLERFTARILGYDSTPQITDTMLKKSSQTITGEELQNRVYADCGFQRIARIDVPIDGEEEPEQQVILTTQVHLDGLRNYGSQQLINKRRTMKVTAQNYAKYGRTGRMVPQQADFRHNVFNYSETERVIPAEKTVFPEPKPTRAVLMAMLSGESSSISPQKYFERASLLWMYDEVLKKRFSNLAIKFITYDKLAQLVGETAFFANSPVTRTTASHAIDLAGKLIDEEYTGQTAYVVHFAYGTDNALDSREYIDKVEELVENGVHFLHAELMPPSKTYSIRKILEAVDHPNLFTGRISNKSELAPLLTEFMQDAIAA